jgi:type I restriction enzyme S subunit
MNNNIPTLNPYPTYKDPGVPWLGQIPVHSIANLTHPTEAAMDYAQRQIALIREYRTRLVADVVTDQLNVRNMALPAENVSVDKSLPDWLETEDLKDDISDLTIKDAQEDIA